MVKKFTKEDAIKLCKWEQYPSEQKGGQTVGILNMGSTLKCEDLEFSISCNASRSQMKNKEFCMIVFELYLLEFKIVE